MPPSLRKACHACSQSKRRCIPRLPSCDRCAKKQIPCRYDLEPVSQGEILPERQQDIARCGTGNADDAGAEQDFKIVYHSVKSAREASIVAMADGHTLESVATHPKLVGTPQLTIWILNFFSDVVRDAQMGRATPFVHIHILQSTETKTEESGLKSEYFLRIAQIHELMIQTLTLLLDRSSSKSGTDVDNFVAETFSSAHELWLSPPTQFDDSFTPWEIWILAESIRRSIMAATMIKAILSFTRTGYVTYEPFFESCPFDPRAGLWEATNEAEWKTLLEKHGGEQAKLKSYHEFVTGAVSNPDSPQASDSKVRLDPSEDGAFQRLLFTCYHSDAVL